MQLEVILEDCAVGSAWDLNELRLTKTSLLPFYRSGCVTCATIQAQFSAVSTKLSSPHLTFGAVDCSGGGGGEFCSGGEPTLVLHRSGGQSERYHHDMTSRDMYNFLVSKHDEL